MRTTVLRIFGVAAFVALTVYASPVAPPVVAAVSGPQLQSLGPLSFGPDGTMFAGDSAAGTVYALDLGAQASGGMRRSAATSVAIGTRLEVGARVTKNQAPRNPHLGLLNSAATVAAASTQMNSAYGQTSASVNGTGQP